MALVISFLGAVLWCFEFFGDLWANDYCVSVLYISFFAAMWCFEAGAAFGHSWAPHLQNCRFRQLGLVCCLASLCSGVGNERLTQYLFATVLLHLMTLASANW